MKKHVSIVVISFLILISFYSCAKDPTDFSKNITGEWSWIKTVAIFPYETSTPETTGVYEILMFTSDQKWIKLENFVRVDSGQYSIGHGNYLPYQGAKNYIYDSVVFFIQSSNEILWDYYDIHGDTLQFCPGYAGKLWAYGSFIFPNGFNGSKFWKKK
jgi:hypothetical protein